MRAERKLNRSRASQAVQLHLDLGDPKAAARKLQGLPNISHIFFFGPPPGVGGDAAAALAQSLASYQSLVAAARDAGCVLRLTQFTCGDPARGVRSANYAHVVPHAAPRSYDVGTLFIA